MCTSDNSGGFRVDGNSRTEQSFQLNLTTVNIDTLVDQINGSSSLV